MSKNKKPIYKRAWFWAVAVIVVVGTSGGADTDNSNETNSGNAESVQEVSQSNNENTIAENESKDKAEDTVPEEYKKALKKAQFYAKPYRNMSKEQVRCELLSIRAGKLSDEAIQYAMDNVEADWKEHALRRAKDLHESGFFSLEYIYDALTSIYTGFTEEEAQYAIDNLDK